MKLLLANKLLSFNLDEPNKYFSGVSKSFICSMKLFIKSVSFNTSLKSSDFHQLSGNFFFIDSYLVLL